MLRVSAFLGRAVAAKVISMPYVGAVSARGARRTPLRSVVLSSEPSRLVQETTMQDEALLSRITADPEIFGGKPVVRARCGFRSS